MPLREKLSLRFLRDLTVEPLQVLFAFNMSYNLVTPGVLYIEKVCCFCFPNYQFQVCVYKMFYVLARKKSFP